MLERTEEKYKKIFAEGRNDIQYYGGMGFFGGLASGVLLSSNYRRIGFMGMIGLGFGLGYSIAQVHYQLKPLHLFQPDKVEMVANEQ